MASKISNGIQTTFAETTLNHIAVWALYTGIFVHLVFKVPLAKPTIPFALVVLAGVSIPILFVVATKVYNWIIPCRLQQIQRVDISQEALARPNVSKHVAQLKNEQRTLLGIPYLPEVCSCTVYLQASGSKHGLLATGHRSTGTAGR
jgi:hypothetical protein